MSPFRLQSNYSPQGDQPRAIEALRAGLAEGKRFQTLLGVTGSGKTYTIANVVKDLDVPVLVISHNKTLAAQLFSEFRSFFPDSSVEYFVSYYDYYQPEAYIPQRDLYIEKDASINEDLDRLRLAATSSLMTRPDVVIVASVSCIYGLGSPAEYEEMMVRLKVGEEHPRRAILERLQKIQYSRNDIAFGRGKFRVRGDVVEIHPAYDETAIRVELFGDTIEGLSVVDPLTGEILKEMNEVCIYPAKHFVLPEGSIEGALMSIEEELVQQLEVFRGQGKLVEAQRLEARTRYDMEMLEELGYCPGVENYSRHLSSREPGTRPYTLLDYFPKDFICVIDESHATIPQIRGMFNGDQARKRVLVEHGFRLPSALDNRPLKFEEFEKLVSRCIFISATPSDYEFERSGAAVEQLIRPTGLVDPPIEIRPVDGQIQDLLREIDERAERGERVLVTTLTKRLAEDLAHYIDERETIRGRYLHSEIDAIERVEILRDLRLGDFDVLVGVNLLREGLDLPEVTLVAILDADKEGFLRSRTSLIQTIGRTARNVDGRVILYADRVTKAMQQTIEETSRRREVQEAYNVEHNITPTTVQADIKQSIAEIVSSSRADRAEVEASEERLDLAEKIGELEAEMFALAEELKFEEAAAIRDRILELQGKTPTGAVRKTAIKRRWRDRGRKKGGDES